MKLIGRQQRGGTMKKLSVVAGTFLAAVVAVLAGANLAGVQALTSDTKADEVVRSSVRKVGREVNVNGTIYGDVFCAGQKVHVDATVYGDVLCAGAEVTIAGKVEGDVRAAGQKVTITANVSKNASVAASKFLLDRNAKVGQDLSATGTELDVKGSVGRDVSANGRTIALDGPVARNAEVSSSDVSLMNSARIGGGLYYTSARDAKIGQQAEVKGETKRTEPQKSKNMGLSFLFYIFALIGFTLISVVFALLFPRFMQKTSDRIMQSAPKSVLIGFLGGLAMMVITVGLLFTLVGIPLALMLVLAGIIGAILSGPIAAYWLGRVLMRTKENANPGVVALFGAPILVTLAWMPWIGWPVKLVTYWLGFGALLWAVKPFVGRKAAAPVKVAASKPKTSKK